MPRFKILQNREVLHGREAVATLKLRIELHGPVYLQVLHGREAVATLKRAGCLLIRRDLLEFSTVVRPWPH